MWAEDEPNAEPLDFEQFRRQALKLNKQDATREYDGVRPAYQVLTSQRLPEGTRSHPQPTLENRSPAVAVTRGRPNPASSRNAVAIRSKSPHVDRSKSASAAPTLATSALVSDACECPLASNYGANLGGHGGLASAHPTHAVKQNRQRQANGSSPVDRNPKRSRLGIPGADDLTHSAACHDAIRGPSQAIAGLPVVQPLGASDPLVSNATVPAYFTFELDCSRIQAVLAALTV